MRLRWALAIAAVVVLLDQLTKAWIVATTPFGSESEVIPGLFRLVHTRNRGIAFGLLGSSGPAVQVGLLLVVILIVLMVVRQLARSGQDALPTAGLALILGGAVGNLVDRLVRGEVVDFLLAYVRISGREHAWPAFNVADSAISVGAGCVILAEIVAAVRHKRVASTD